VYEKETGPQQSNNEDHVYVSRQALKFAVEDRLPPIKIQCDPILKNQEDGLMIANEFLKHIETKFRKMNRRYSEPLGFTHYLVDKNGALVCYTNYIEVFIYVCDFNNYPADTNNVRIQPLLPLKLPAKNAIRIKFIDNKLTFEDIQTIVLLFLFFLINIPISIYDTILHLSRFLSPPSLFKSNAYVHLTQDVSSHCL
jgi:hypothetical protein